MLAPVRRREVTAVPAPQVGQRGGQWGKTPNDSRPALLTSSRDKDKAGDKKMDFSLHHLSLELPVLQAAMAHGPLGKETGCGTAVFPKYFKNHLLIILKMNKVEKFIPIHHQEDKGTKEDGQGLGGT